MGVWMTVQSVWVVTVGDAEAPLMTLSLLVGGPLASVRAEAASLLQLLLDVAGQYGRNI